MCERWTPPADSFCGEVCHLLTRRWRIETLTCDATRLNLLDQTSTLHYPEFLPNKAQSPLRPQVSTVMVFTYDAFRNFMFSRQDYRMFGLFLNRSLRQSTTNQNQPVPQNWTEFVDRARLQDPAWFFQCLDFSGECFDLYIGKHKLLGPHQFRNRDRATRGVTRKQSILHPQKVSDCFTKPVKGRVVSAQSIHRVAGCFLSDLSCMYYRV